MKRIVDSWQDRRSGPAHGSSKGTCDSVKSSAFATFCSANCPNLTSIQHKPLALIHLILKDWWIPVGHHRPWPCHQLLLTWKEERESNKNRNTKYKAYKNLVVLVWLAAFPWDIPKLTLGMLTCSFFLSFRPETWHTQLHWYHLLSFLCFLVLGSTPSHKKS